MKTIDIDNLFEPKRIGLCYRDGSEHDRYAFIEFENKDRLVSTIEFYAGEGLTIGEYFEGRISDLNYCIKNKDETSLNIEFELWQDGFHREDYTGEHGVENI